MRDLDAALAAWWNTPNATHTTKPPLVMIERDPDYCAIAAKRLRETQPMMNFDAAPSAYTEALL